MKSRIHLIFLLLILLFVCPDAKAQFSRSFGWCEQGGQPITVSGLPGAPLAQGSYPQCTITVFLTGTTTPATIYSDKGITPLGGGTFQASANGYWFFYAATGTEVDIQESGAGLTTFTWGDVTVGNANSSPLSVNGATVPFPNLANSASITWTVNGVNISGSIGGVPLLSSTNAFTGINSFAINPTFLGNPALSVSGTALLGQCPVFLSASVVQAITCPTATNLLISNNLWTGSNSYNLTPTFNGLFALAVVGNPVIGNCPSFASGTTVGDSGAPCGGGSPSNLTLLSQDTPATTITDTGSWSGAGPNPAIDITAPPYFVRRVAQSFGTTATCTAGSASITLAVASSFQNHDGIDVQGCGAPTGLTTPNAPTITPIEATGPIGSYHNAAAATGASSFQYQLVAIAFGKGYTPAGSLTVTTTANPIGTQTATVSTITRAGGTSLAATVVTSASQTIASGATVTILGSSDTGCNGGPYLVASVTNNTTFVINTGDSVTGGATASCTGGTVTWFQGNHIAWPAVTGNPMQYAIYGRTSGSMAFLGLSRIGELQWDDFGSAISNWSNPYSWLPSTPPVSGKVNDLVSTIISGAGTTFLTLANTATTSFSGGAALFDSSPGTRAAAIVATTSNTAGRLSWPAGSGQYIYNSFLDMNAGLGGNQVLVGEISNQITANMPWALHRGSKLLGNRSGAGMDLGAFAWEGCPDFVVGTAYPAVYYPGATFADVVDCISFKNANNNGLTMQIMGNGAFNFTIKNSYFLNGSGGGDLSGLGFVAYGMANMRTENTYMAGSTPINSFGITSAPVGLLVNDQQNINGSGSFTAMNPYFSTRGIGVTSIPPLGGGVQYTFSGISYDQGADQAILTLDTSGRANFVEFRNCTNDTSDAPMVANIAGNTALSISNCGSTGVGLPLVSGFFTNFNLTNSAIPPPLNNSDYPPNEYGQNQSAIFNIPQEQVNPMAPYNTTNASQFRYPVYEIRENMRFPAQHAAFWDLACPTTVTATPTTGGSINPGTYYYQIACVGAAGGESAISVPSNACVLSGANNACALSWTGVANAVSYNAYRCVTGNCSGTVNGVGSGAGITTNSFTDTSNAMNGNFYPAMNAGTGSTVTKADMLVAPQLILTTPLGSAGVSYKLTVAPATFTANRTLATGDGAMSAVIPASLVTTAATTDTVTIQGITASSHCQISATNAAAATNFTTTFLSTPTTNSIVVNHTATANMNYNLACTVN